MLSKMGYLGDSAGHWCPHLMIHVPTTGEASWGANLAGSPVLFNDENRDVPEPETIFYGPGRVLVGWQRCAGYGTTLRAISAAC